MRVALFLFAARLAAAQSPDAWTPLFDGKTLAGWKETAFRDRGPARVDAGRLILGAGMPLTGVTYTRSFPTNDYEIRFEASRIDGGDFFASLTFPVGASFCTLVTGGWGGDIVGLSSIDGWDAADNETRTYVNFEKGRWYAFRLRVTAEHISVWIDEERVVHAPIGGRTISLRPGDIKLSAPLGFASYGSTGAMRKIEYRRLAHP